MQLRCFTDDENAPLVGTDQWASVIVNRTKVRGISLEERKKIDKRPQAEPRSQASRLRSNQPASRQRSRILLNTSLNYTNQDIMLPSTAQNIQNKQIDQIKQNKENKIYKWRIKNGGPVIPDKNVTVGLSLYNRIQAKQVSSKKPIIEPLREQKVLAYEKEIWEHISDRDTAIQPFPTYLEQSYLNKLYNLRFQALNLVASIHQKLTLNWETLQLSAHLFDCVAYSQISFLPTEVGDQEILGKFKLIAISALFVSAKTEEVYATPSLKDLVTYTGKASRQQILEMEGIILQTVQFDLIFNSPIHYVHALTIQLGITGQQRQFMIYLLELSVLDQLMQRYSSIMKAVCAIVLMSKHYNINLLRNEKIQRICKRIEGSELSKCQIDMQNLYLKQSQNQNSISKKYLQFQQNDRGKLLRVI